MCSREHDILQVSLCRNSLVPNKEIALKYLSQRFGSAGILVSYRITVGGPGCNEGLVPLRH